MDNGKKWYEKNLFVADASKSNSILVTKRQREIFLDDELEMYLGDDKLDDVDVCKYLGLTTDKNFNWWN